MKRDSLDALTGLRFFAAAHVVLYHFAGPAIPEGAPSWLHHFVGHGYVGVNFFYLLSGFIITYNYAEDDAGGVRMRGSRREFWLRRFSRVYPLYFFAWLLAAPAVLAHRIASDAGPLAALGKLLIATVTSLGLMQAWIPGAQAWWNPPSWSISVEAFFYLAFPFLLPRMVGRPGLARRMVTCFAIAIAGPLAYVLLAPSAPLALAVVKYNPLLHLPSFALGMALAAVHRSEERRAWIERHRWMLLLGGAALVTVFVCRPVDDVYLLIHNGLLSPAFAAMILALSVEVPFFTRALSSRALVLLGNASYGVYILQAPLWHYWRKLADGVTIPALLDRAAYFTFLCLVSVGAYYLLERPAQRVLRRRWATA